MKDTFKERLYEALMYSFGRILSKYNMFAQETVLRDVGKDIIQYLNQHGFPIDRAEDGTPLPEDILNSFVKYGFVDEVETKTGTEGIEYIWKNLYGIDAYAELQKTVHNPFLACPLNACISYAAAKQGKRLALYKKHFDTENRIGYSEEGFEEKKESDQDGFDSLIIENARLYELAEERAEKLKQQNQHIRSLLAVISHDIRNPISSVYSAIKMLEEELSSAFSAEQRELIEEMKAACMDTISLTEELVDFSQVETGKASLHRDTVDYKALVGKAISLVKPKGKEKNITIQLKEDTKLSLLTIDRTKILRVLENLLSNAIKYSYPDSEVFVHLTKEKDGVRTAVENKGEGFSDTEAQLLFHPYSKTTTKATAGESSYGLGLWIAKKIVEWHNGYIRANSIPGDKTVFEFFLPYSEQEGCTHR